MLELLLIEDDVVDRRVAREAISASGMQARITEARTGEEGVTFIEEGEYDCVLLDLNLPDMDGMQIMRRISEIDAERRPTVIVMTGAGSEKAAVQAMRMGVSDYLIKGELTAADTERAVASAMARHEARKADTSERARMERMALTDPLTGLGNRNLLAARLSHALDRAKRDNGEVCALLFDLDGFKAINDRHGHRAGDEVLREIGSRLRSITRVSDTVARIGGDEFIVVMETCATRVGAVVLANRIRAAVSRPIEWQGSTLNVGCSIGAAFSNDGFQSVDELIGAADEAMYSAKQEHKTKLLAC